MMIDSRRPIGVCLPKGDLQVARTHDDAVRLLEVKWARQEARERRFVRALVALWIVALLLLCGGIAGLIEGWWG